MSIFIVWNIWGVAQVIGILNLKTPRKRLKKQGNIIETKIRVVLIRWIVEDNLLKRGCSVDLKVNESKLTNKEERRGICNAELDCSGFTWLVEVSNGNGVMFAHAVYLTDINNHLNEKMEQQVSLMKLFSINDNIVVFYLHTNYLTKHQNIKWVILF